MSELLKRIVRISGENTFACYQCGECSSSCPFVEFMDVMPSQLVKLVQIGDERVLRMRAPWICVSCFNCTRVCPRGVNVAAMMEALRLISLRRGIDAVNLRRIEGIEGIPQIVLIAASRRATG